MSGPAAISGNKVTLTGEGMVVLATNQSGNANYTAAPEVTTSFSVGADPQSQPLRLHGGAGLLGEGQKMRPPLSKHGEVGVAFLVPSS
ncbi:MAG: hypothetical protein WCO97_10775 [bacterium]